MAKERKPDDGKHIGRVRRICAAMPECEEKLSHGEPTFFVRKKVFAMFSNNHHNDGHVAVLVPTSPGLQELLINDAPKTYFYPAYVGCAAGLVSSWIASAMKIWRCIFVRPGN